MGEVDGAQIGQSHAIARFLARKYSTTDLPEWCKKLETSIQTFQSTSGYAVGPAMSLADVVIYAWLSFYYPAERKDEVEAAYAGCAHISKIMSTMGSHPGIS